MTNVGFFRSDTAVGKAHLENVRLIANELGMKVALTCRSRATSATCNLTIWYG